MKPPQPLQDMQVSDAGEIHMAPAKGRGRQGLAVLPHNGKLILYFYIWAFEGN